MDAQLIFWTVIAAALVGACVYGYIEYQSYLLRTDVSSVPGGLRFTSRQFTVESRQSAKQVVVICKNGRFKSQPMAGGDGQMQSGALNVNLTAPGLHIKVAHIVVRDGGDEAEPQPTGFSSITFTASDEMLCKATGKTEGEHATLRIDQVPDPIAMAFKHFAGGLEVWIEKVEHNLALDIAAREEEAAKAAAAAAKAELAAQEPEPEVDLEPAEREAKAKAQLATWRQAAGFAGTTTEVNIDAKGNFVWMIDLNPDGRVIVHSTGRTFYGSLLGAVVTMLPDELELAVRDEYWQEGDTRLSTFRILKGATPESRLAWKKRITEAMDRFQENPDKKSI